MSGVEQLLVGLDLHLVGAGNLEAGDLALVDQEIVLIGELGALALQGQVAPAPLVAGADLRVGGQRLAERQPALAVVNGSDRRLVLGAFGADLKIRLIPLGGAGELGPADAFRVARHGAEQVPFWVKVSTWPEAVVTRTVSGWRLSSSALAITGVSPRYHS